MGSNLVNSLNTGTVLGILIYGFRYYLQETAKRKLHLILQWIHRTVENVQTQPLKLLMLLKLPTNVEFLGVS